MTAIKYKEDGVWKTLTMPSAVHIGTAAPDEDVKQLWVDTYAVTPPYGYVPPLVTALPTAPFDGQTVHYQNAAMATDGVVWTFRYRAASLSAYKWEYVGGHPIEMESTTNWGSRAALADLAGFQITIPLAGEFYVEVYAALIAAENPSQSAYLTYKIGAAAAVLQDGITTRTGTTSANDFKTHTAKRRKTIPAGTVLQVQAGSSSGPSYPSGNTNYPTAIRAWPVRVS